MASIYLYQTEITPERNCRVDSILSYLGTLTNTYYNGSLIETKIAKELDMKLSMSQKNVGTAIGNYCRLFQDSRNYYFFITSAKWISESAVSLHLKLDTLNTYWTDLSWNVKTEITREHRDRWSKIQGQSNRFQRKIDTFTEGQLFPKYKNDTEDVYIRDSYDSNWNLVYLSDVDAATTVRCFIVPDNILYLKMNTTQCELSAGSLVKGTYYYLLAPTTNYDVNIKNTGKKLCTINWEETQTTGGTFTWATVYVDEYNYIHFIQHIKNQEYDTARSKWVTTYVDSESIFGSDVILSLSATSAVTYHYSGTLTDTYSTAKGYSTSTWAVSGSTTYSLKRMSSWDMTDSKLLKALKLPYCPLDLTITNSTINYSSLSGLTYSSAYNALELTDLHTKFSHTIDIASKYTPRSDMYLSFTPTKGTTRNDNYESKLYHSDYYQPKFIYDSFSFPINLEEMAVTDLSSFNVIFKPTSTINSRFAFLFDDYWCGNTTQDYSNVLNVARNNELTIYNSAYLEYIKAGYNYDVKSKNISLASSLATGIASTAIGAVTGGIAGAAAGLVTGAISLTANQISAQNNIDQKLAQLKEQATTVSGADDVDLLEAYSQNRMKVSKYSIKDDTKSTLAGIFYYTGYSHPVQEIPDFTSRCYFNYVQCTPVFNNQYTQVYSDYLDDIRARFEAGVTVFHQVNGTWNWNQNYENWEVSIL